MPALPQRLLRVAIEAATAPAPGGQDPPFRWEDVLDGPAPGSRERGPPRYCVPGFEMVSGGVRVENPILVIVHDGGVVEVEDRLCVTTRALAGAIETEREVVGLALHAARRRNRRLAQRGQAAARRLERRSWPLGRLVALLVALAHRISDWTLRGVRALSRSVAAMPDRVGNAARRAQTLLATPEGRRRVLDGLKDPRRLDRYEKAVTLFVGTSALLMTLLVAHLAVTLAAPGRAVGWRSALLLFLYGYVSSVGIPLPWEPVLIAGAVAIGAWPAIVIAIAAKLAAGYMVFFIGDEINEKLETRAARSPWFGRFVRASEAFASRFGTFAMALFIGIPGLPDAIALYVFGSLHMPLRRYLLGLAIGAFALNVIVIFGALRLLGH